MPQVSSRWKHSTRDLEAITTCLSRTTGKSTSCIAQPPLPTRRREPARSQPGPTERQANAWNACARTDIVEGNAIQPNQWQQGLGCRGSRHRNGRAARKPPRDRVKAEAAPAVGSASEPATAKRADGRRLLGLAASRKSPDTVQLYRLVDASRHSRPCQPSECRPLQRTD